jgi:hypothetical protein
VAAGPTELEVDAAGMGAARAAAWRQRRPQRGGSAGRDGAGGVEGAEVAAGPAELEVDAADMESAWAAAWRKHGPQRGGSAGHGIDVAPAEWEVAEVAAGSGAARGARG